MNVLVAGLGSIARKHIAALRRLVPDVNIYALRSGKRTDDVDGVQNIYDKSECPLPDFIIISNPTALHGEAIRDLLLFERPLFIEKPPFHDLNVAQEISRLVSEKEVVTYTACNLRFLPAMQYIKETLDQSKVLEATIYCGSYLPDWRPGTDFKKSYSANASIGGGAHLDLFHEMDYTFWLFGVPSATNSYLRSDSTLQIDAIDAARYILAYDKFMAGITLNYFRRDARRTIEIVQTDRTILVDLLKNTVRDLTNEKVIFESSLSPGETYLPQMQYFLGHLKAGTRPENSIEESIKTLKAVLS